MSYAIIRAEEQVFRSVTELAGMNGVRVAPLIDAGHGSVHLEIAQHHTLFVVEFAANSGTSGRAARTHYHPFEEAYYFVSGSAIAFLDGDQHEIAAGDLVWSGTNSTHGYINQGDVPVRFIECQAPKPPASNAFFFPDDWHALSNGMLRMDAKGDTRFPSDDDPAC